MNEIQLVLLALVVLAVSVVVFYLVKTIPDEIEDKKTKFFPSKSFRTEGSVILLLFP
jgi:hypothetical protein